MSELDRDLQDLRERLAERETAMRRLERNRGELSSRGDRLAELRRTLDAEREDVEELEGLSLAGIFHYLRGDKKERLADERRELLEAKLRFDECAAVLEALEREGSDLEQRIEALGDLDAERAELLRRKEERLLQGDGPTARRLFELADELADARSRVREVVEARASGELAHGSLEALLDRLGEAKTWGIMDTYGGGLLITMIKHSHLDEARDLAHEAQGNLLRFQNELTDVRFGAELSVQLSEFDTFADYYIDCFIFDWEVQGKIQRTLNAAEETAAEVETLLGEIEAELVDAERRVEELEGRRAAWIEEG